MGRRVVASYCSSFLKPEMLHIYRQVKALRGVDTFVVTKEVQNAERFPFAAVEVIPKRRTNLLVHGWLKFVQRRPPIVYRGEYQTLDFVVGAAWRRSDAYLFWTYRRAPAPFHRAMGQTVRGIFSWRGCRPQKRHQGLSGKAAPSFQSGSTRVCAFPITGRPIDPPGLPAGKTANQSHWYPRSMNFHSLIDNHPAMENGESCKRAG